MGSFAQPEEAVIFPRKHNRINANLFYAFYLLIIYIKVIVPQVQTLIMMARLP